MEWISVNDRLPDMGEYVLGISPHLEKILIVRRNKFGYVDYSIDYHEIIYWMPLPEPPKEATP